MAEAGTITPPRNELLDIADLVKNIAPLLTGTNKTSTGTTTTVSGSAIDPNTLSQNDQLMATLVGRATSNSQSDALVEDIMHRAAIAFAPVLGEERAAGGYNSTARKLLSDEAMARATAAAAQAVMENQTKALDQATQLQASRNALAANTAQKTSTATTASADKTPPAITGKQIGVGAAGAGILGLLQSSGLLQALNIAGGAKNAKSLYDTFFGPGKTLTDAQKAQGLPGFGGSEATTTALEDIGVPEVSELPATGEGVSAVNSLNAETYTSGIEGAYTPESVDAAEGVLGEYGATGVSENVASIEQLMQQLGLPQQLSFDSPLVSELIGQAGDLPGMIQFASYTGAPTMVDATGLQGFVGEQYAAQTAAEEAAAAQAAEQLAAEQAAAEAAATEAAASEAASTGAATGAGELSGELGTAAQAADATAGEAFAGDLAAEGYGASEISAAADAFGYEGLGAATGVEAGVGALAGGELAAGTIEGLGTVGAEAFGLGSEAFAGAGLAEGLFGGATAAEFGGAALGAEAIGGATLAAEGAGFAELLPLVLAWVICTELKSTGELDTELYDKGAKHWHKVSKTTIRGYHIWAVPYTRWMRKSKFARKLMVPIARGRTQHLAGNWNLIGFLTIYLAEPICWLLGKFCKPSSNWRELYGPNTGRT